MDVPVARRVERPGWLNLRTVLGVLLFAAAFLGSQRVLEAARDTTQVWVAARDLPADEVISATDLKLVEARLPGALGSTYLETDAQIDGYVLARPVLAGELIPESAIAAGGPAGPARSMTVPVSPEHAVGGSIRPGDLIDVFATFDAGQPQARTHLLLRSAEVLHVVSTGGLVMGEEAVVGITVAIDPEQAPALALAIRSAEIDIALVRGPSSVSTQSSARSSEYR